MQSPCLHLASSICTWKNIAPLCSWKRCTPSHKKLLMHQSCSWKLAISEVESRTSVCPAKTTHVVPLTPNHHVASGPTSSLVYDNLKRHQSDQNFLCAEIKKQNFTSEVDGIQVLWHEKCFYESSKVPGPYSKKLSMYCICRWCQFQSLKHTFVKQWSEKKIQWSKLTAQK